MISQYQYNRVIFFKNYVLTLGLKREVNYFYLDALKDKVLLYTLNLSKINNISFNIIYFIFKITLKMVEMVILLLLTFILIVYNINCR